MDSNQKKLNWASLIAYCLLFGALFGYSINKDLYFTWLIIEFIGGLLLTIKKIWLKPEVKFKVILSEMSVTLVLILFIFNESLPVPMLIKQIITLLVIFIFGFLYFRLLYNGKLTSRG
jgi:hypothetical protein